MSKMLLSIQGGRVTQYLFSEKPSSYIPFKGNFPLVPEYRTKEVYDIIHSHRYLDECPEWFQTAILHGEQIFLIERGFIQYLTKHGKLEKFDKMSSADKSTELVKFMNDASLGLDRLKINC